MCIRSSERTRSGSESTFTRERIARLPFYRQREVRRRLQFVIHKQDAGTPLNAGDLALLRGLRRIS